MQTLITNDKANRQRRRTLLAVVIAAAMAFTGCTKTEEAAPPKVAAPAPVVVQPAQVVRPAPSRAVLTANVGVTLAVNQYAYARLMTEVFATTDFSKASDSKEAALMLSDAQEAWKHADVAIDGAIILADNARTAPEEPVETEQPETGTPSKGKGEDKAEPAPGTTSDVALGGPGGADFGVALAEFVADSSATDWAAPFTDYYETSDQMTILGRLLLELQSDASLVQAKLETASLKVDTAAPADLADIAKDAGLSDAAKVGLYVTSTAVPPGGSVKPLAAAEAGAMDPESFVVTGVDGLVIMGTDSSKIMLGHEKQVTVAKSDLGSDADSFSAVIGLVDLDPTGSGAVAGIEDLENSLVQLGRQPAEWFMKDEVPAIAVDEQPDNTAKVDITPVPKGATPRETEANLQANGVRPAPAPNQPIAEIAREVRADPVRVTQVIEILITVVEDGPPDGPSDVEQGIADAPPPTTGGSRPVDVSAVAGSYGIVVDGELTTSTDVALSGDSMTITFTNDAGTVFVLTGPFDASTGSYTTTSSTYSNAEYGESGGGGVGLDIVFDTNASPITASGTAWDELGSYPVTLVKN